MPPHAPPLRPVGPTEIPADAEPSEQVDLVIEAIHATYPNRVWTQGDRRVWLDDSGSLRDLSCPRFWSMVTRCTVLLKPRKGGMQRGRVPRAVGTDAYNDWSLAPELQGVRRCPWVTADGTVCNTPGLHDDGFYLHWEGEPAHPDAVSDDEMWRILDKLLDHPFVSDDDRLAYLGLLLRCVCPLVGHPSPLYAIVATVPESGKSLAAELVGRVLLGSSNVPSFLPAAGFEWDYSLKTYLDARRAYSWVDNVASGSTVGGANLHALMTARGDISGRTVQTGLAEGADPTRSIWVVTGIDLRYDGEQARRTIPIRLRYRLPSEPFKTPDLLGWALQKRREIVSALLRFMVRWHDLGAPKPPKVLRTYEEWSRQIGGALCAVHPLGPSTWLTEDSRPSPPLEAALGRLFETHWPRDEQGRPLPQTSRELVGLVERIEILELLEAIAHSRDRPTKLGNVLRPFVQQGLQVPIAGRWRLMRTEIDGRNRYWPRPWQPPGSGPGSGGGSGGCRQPPPQTPTAKTPFKPGRVGVVGVGEVCPDPANDSPVPPPPTNTTLPPLQPTPTTPTTPTDGGRTLGLGVGVCSESVGVGEVSPSEPDVQLPPDDPIHPYVVAMARRGVAIDPELLAARYEAAEDELAGREDRESIHRLKAMRSYAPAMLAAARSDPQRRVRCGWDVEGTGRIGTVRPAIRCMTKGYGLREAVIAGAGNRLVVGDFDCAHVWIAAGLSGDRVLLEALVRGDVYTAGAAVWAPELSDGGRKAAKVAILATLNGAGAAKLADTLQGFGVEVTPSEALKRREVWKDGYPDLRRWLSRGQEQRAWTTPLGRHVALPDDEPDYKAVGWLLQSVEADALRLVLKRYTGQIVLTNHDEVVADEPAELADEMAARMREVMDAALREVTGLDVEVTTCTVDVRDHWGRS